MCDNCFTSTVDKNTPEIDLDKINKDIGAEIENYKSGLLDAFSGIPVHVDTELKEFEYYIVVSPKIYAELLNKNLKP